MAVSHLAVEGSVLYPTLHLRHRLLPGDGHGGVPAIGGVSARYDRPLCPPVSPCVPVEGDHTGC